MKDFLPLRAGGGKARQVIKVASDHHARPDEACKLIGNFPQAETKMIKYVETNAAKMRNPAANRRAAEEGPCEHRGHAEEGL